MTVKNLSALSPPAMTTAQRDAIPAGRRPPGSMIYNTTTSRLEVNLGSDATPSWGPLIPSQLGMERLFDTGVIGANQAILADWQSIPQTYKHLVMIVSADATSGTGLEFRFNGDGSATYQGQELDVIGTAITASLLGVVAQARYSVAWGSGIYSTSLSIIPNYTAVRVKSVLSMMSGYDNTQFNLRMLNGYWGVNQALNRIQLGCWSSGASYKAGSQATLYGLG